MGLKGGVGWGGTVSRTVSQAVKRGKIQNSNHLHNVKHVLQSTFEKNTKQLLKYKPCNSNFELYSK